MAEKSRMSSGMAITGIILMIIGLLMFIGFLVWYFVEKTTTWALWVAFGGLVLAVIGAILLAAAYFATPKVVEPAAIPCDQIPAMLPKTCMTARPIEYQVSMPPPAPHIVYTQAPQETIYKQLPPPEPKIIYTQAPAPPPVYQQMPTVGQLVHKTEDPDPVAVQTTQSYRGLTTIPGTGITVPGTITETRQSAYDAPPRVTYSASGALEMQSMPPAPLMAQPPMIAQAPILPPAAPAAAAAQHAQVAQGAANVAAGASTRANLAAAAQPASPGAQAAARASTQQAAAAQQSAQSAQQAAAQAAQAEIIQPGSPVAGAAAAQAAAHSSNAQVAAAQAHQSAEQATQAAARVSQSYVVGPSGYVTGVATTTPPGYVQSMAPSGTPPGYVQSLAPESAAGMAQMLGNPPQVRQQAVPVIPPGGVVIPGTSPVRLSQSPLAPGNVSVQGM